MKRFWLSLAALFCLTTVGFAQTPDWTPVEKVLGRSGTVQGDMLKVAFPRSDLHVKVDQVPIKPDLALTAWMVFKPHGNDTMVMGDLVLLPQEMKAVETELVHHGFGISGIHNHITGETPQIMYMHIEGTGQPIPLAQALKNVLQHTTIPLTPAAASPPPLPGNWTAVESLLGFQGKNKGEVIQFSIPRNDTIMENGMNIPPFMGMATAINFQKAGNEVVSTGDFVLLPEEVPAVVNTLVQNGITVTALHNHMLNESPRLFFLHFWAKGTPEHVAKALRQALEKTNIKTPQ